MYISKKKKKPSFTTSNTNNLVEYTFYLTYIKIIWPTNNKTLSNTPIKNHFRNITSINLLKKLLKKKTPIFLLLTSHVISLLSCVKNEQIKYHQEGKKRKEKRAMNWGEILSIEENFENILSTQSLSELLKMGWQYQKVLLRFYIFLNSLDYILLFISNMYFILDLIMNFL